MSFRFVTQVVDVGGKHEFRLRLPAEASGLTQDEEWFEVQRGGRWERLRMHDYSELFSDQGLYEALVYKLLECRSPGRVAAILNNTLADVGCEGEDLRVLDLGAGNGIVAEELRARNATSIVGVDILDSAREAAERDRPGVYDDYVVADLCAPSPATIARLRKHKLNCLVSVAALGFGDIPPLVFATALDLIQTPGWLAFTIKEDFLANRDGTGFSRLVRDLEQRRVIRIDARHRMWHRLSLSGRKLFYVALIARKTSEVPAEVLDELRAEATEV
jgi:SAM-dependent methyltransferase